MNNELNPFRKLAKDLAFHAQNELKNFDDPDTLPLDGDQTEELSMMFQEELDILNANT